MIHEYFVEPALIYKWARNPKDTKKFLSEIGLGNPRLLSTFPKSKPSKLRGELLRNAPDNLEYVARNRLDILVEGLTSHSILRQVTSELPQDWFVAATEESQARCPDLIISENENAGIANWIVEDSIYGENSPYDLPRDSTPVRTKEALTDVIRNLLRYSTNIILVEPYAYKDSGIASLIAFIAAAQKGRLSKAQVCFKVLMKAEKGDAKYLYSQLMEAAELDGMALEVLAIEEKEEGEKFHNRYVLTELGGVDFGVGTDEGEAFQTDDLSLLGRERYEKRWNQYVDAGAFVIVDRVTNSK